MCHQSSAGFWTMLGRVSDASPIALGLLSLFCLGLHGSLLCLATVKTLSLSFEDAFFSFLFAHWANTNVRKPNVPILNRWTCIVCAVCNWSAFMLCIERD